MATLSAPGYEFSENFKSQATCKPLVLFDDVALCVFEALEIARTNGQIIAEGRKSKTFARESLLMRLA